MPLPSTNSTNKTLLTILKLLEKEHLPFPATTELKPGPVLGFTGNLCKVTPPSNHFIDDQVSHLYTIMLSWTPAAFL